MSESTPIASLGENVFDNVGRTIDEEANKRRAASVIALAAIGGGIFAIAFAITAWKATEAILEIVEPDMELVEVEITDDEIDEALPPPPPPPPPPPAAADAEEEEEEDDEPDEDIPDEMVDEEQDLEDEVEDAVANNDVPAGQVGGVEGGVEGGEVGGVIGGEIGGVIGGQLGGAVATVHRSEVRIKRQVNPEYPETARDMNLGPVDCRVRIFIGEDGAPYDMRFEACPAPFHDSTREAVMRMRWYPYRVNGQKAKAQFVIKFVFSPGR
jgi:hypothetical protein